MRLPQDRILHIDTEFKDGKGNVKVEWQGELVLCKDCKHYRKVTKNYGICTERPNVITSQKADDFCSYGGRRDE